MKRKQQQVERYMLAVDSIRASKNRILEHLAVKEGQEVQLKELVLSRFEFLDQLGRAFYERNKSAAGGHLQTSEKLLYEPCIQSRDQKRIGGDRKHGK
jgi:hypothetical protein